MIEIVLYEPEIPQNTGSIARLCAATRTPLHLIKPLGFSLEDRYLKRAGLDYWPHVDLHVWDDFPAYRAAKPGRRLVATTAGNRGHDRFLALGITRLFHGSFRQGCGLRPASRLGPDQRAPAPALR